MSDPYTEAFQALHDLFTSNMEPEEKAEQLRAIRQEVSGMLDSMQRRAVVGRRIALRPDLEADSLGISEG